MKFYDEASIIVQSGKGGDGLISGRREKGVPRGGPAGGDGGKGGSIFFVADENEYTLLPLRYKKIRKAKPGEKGQSRDKYGAAADDVYIRVPLGTLVKEKQTGAVLAHLTKHEQLFLAASGGIGGKGNIHFKNATNQYPNIALHGEPGQKKELMVELQLLGDIALIGTPSVGKSTLINSISNVKARTAAYEFTTLVPNLGIVEHKGKSFAMVDVPGLIAGASEGKGLGNMFLRHVLKARAWVIMLDASKDLPGIKERGLLLDEIKQYIETKYIHLLEDGKNDGTSLEHVLRQDGKRVYYQAILHTTTEDRILMNKALITVVNKYDVLDEELWGEYRDALLEHMYAYVNDSTLSLVDSVMTISALTKTHIDTFLDTCLTIVTDMNLSSIASYDTGIIPMKDQGNIMSNITQAVLPFLLEEGYIEEKQSKKIKVWEVQHEKIAYFTYVVPWGNDEAEMRYRQTMAREQYLQRYESHGAKKGDILKICSPYVGTEDRYILRD